MADLTITAASVISHGTIDRGTAAATITAGQAVYRDATTLTWKLSDSNLAGAKACGGIALNGASTGQPLTVHKSGDITAGATLVAGTVYAVSATAGGIAPLADITTGDDVIIIGVAKSTTVLSVAIQTPGVTL